MKDLQAEFQDHEGDLVAIRVSGEIDLANVTQLRDRIFANLPNSALGAVVDLSSVTYLDSAAIRLLFELNRGLTRHGQRLRIVVAAGSVSREVLDHVALGDVVPIDEDREASLEGLRAELKGR